MPISKEGCAGLRTEMCVCTPGLKLPQGSFQSHTPEAVGSRPGLRPGGIHYPDVPHVLTIALQSARAGYALQGHTSGVQAVAVLKDRLLVSASDDYSLIVWDFGVGRS